MLDRAASMIWKQYGFEPWHKALQLLQVDNLTEDERDGFELGFLAAQEASGGGTQRESLFRMAIWGPRDTRRAESLGRYMVRRDGLRDEWLRRNVDAEAKTQLARAASHRDERRRREVQANQAHERYDQLRRLYFTRRQIAAATVLAAADDKQALAEWSGLDECERTAF